MGTAQKNGGRWAGLRFRWWCTRTDEQRAGISSTPCCDARMEASGKGSPGEDRTPRHPPKRHAGKRVRWRAGRGEGILLSHEHPEYRWIGYDDARRLLGYDGDRTALWELHQRLRGHGPRG